MHDNFDLPESSWIALLSIAHRYEFLNVQARAIREIYNPLTEWDRTQPGWEPDPDLLVYIIPDPKTPDHLTLISTAEKYDVPLQEVLPSFVELVMREKPLTEVEIARLSTLTMYRLARAREDYLRRTTRAGVLNARAVAKGIVREIWPGATKK
jgi:hypothetical protein